MTQLELGHLSAAFLERYGLPDISYPIQGALLAEISSEANEIQLAVLLKSLQQFSQHGSSAWLLLEPAMDRISELLAADSLPGIENCQGENWWLELGNVGLADSLVGIQRQDSLIASIARRVDGQLRVAVYRPLDAKSAGYLVGLGLVPHPENGVCMRENNWEYALDSAASSGNYYAWDRNESYLSYWEQGLGVSSVGEDLPVWKRQRSLVPRSPARVSTELAVHCASFASLGLHQLP